MRRESKLIVLSEDCNLTVMSKVSRSFKTWVDKAEVSIWIRFSIRYSM